MARYVPNDTVFIDFLKGPVSHEICLRIGSSAT